MVTLSSIVPRRSVAGIAAVVAVTAAWALCPTGCVRRDAPHTRPTGMDAHATGSRDATADPTRDASPTDVPVVPPSLESVVTAVRGGDLRGARTAAEHLPPALRATREGRYLLARTTLETGNPQAALPYFRDLARDIPVLAVDIARMEAGALARVGRHADARTAYTALADHGGGGDRDRAQAAVEALAAGDARGAVATMRDWAAHPPTGLDRARAWKLAAQALASTGDNSGAVAMWERLAVDEPDTGSATEALTALARLNTGLSVDQVLTRAANLVERARYTEALAALTPMAPARGAVEARRVHLLGRAYYGSRGHYAEASTLLAAAGALADNPDRDEDAFLAARSLARADRDDEAVRAFDAVAHANRGHWSDEAAYRAAWLEAHHEHIEPALARLRGFLQNRQDAPPRLRVEASWELGWMLYTAGRWREAAEALQRSGEVATHHLERGRGRYWAAMARMHAGDADGAVHGWQALRTDRPLTWYALLAESRLRARGVTVTPPEAPPARRPSPAVDLPPRVRWYHALGFDRDAGAALAAEEDRVRTHLPPDRADEALALAYLDLGEARRAFGLSSRHADDLDDLPTESTRWVWDTGFPRPHAAAVEAAEDAGGMPRQYLYAIMRQESGFNDRDVSNARAIGLLQMIPPTTRRVAQSLGIEFREELLYEPAYNIRVGGWYIGRLFQQYHGVLPRAIGSFNAGPGAMGRWIRQSGTLDLDLFVERIPFDETRTYVRRVVQNLARYRYLYGPRDATWPLQVPLTADGAVDTLVEY